jgi:N-acetyldiaminopimelate deacetylase
VLDLPVAEETELPFASAHPGIMHACGHDVHMTVGLGFSSRC